MADRPAPGTPEAIAEIAEKVMGAVPQEPRQCGCMVCEWQDQTWIIATVANRLCVHFGRHWNPYTDATHTEMVIEAMREKGFSWEVQQLKQDYRARASFWIAPATTATFFSCERHDWKEAICEAARMAARRGGINVERNRTDGGGYRLPGLRRDCGHPLDWSGK